MKRRQLLNPSFRYPLQGLGGVENVNKMVPIQTFYRKEVSEPSVLVQLDAMGIYHG
jgi:hypothetical protein